MEFILSQKIANISLTFVNESESFSGVRKVASKVIDDVKRVIDIPIIETCNIDEISDLAIIYGTLGYSPLLDLLKKENKIEFSDICSKREVYKFQIVENPLPNVKSAIVIAGSDKRGTIYGLFHLSEILGVSPLVNWSDVKPVKKTHIVLNDEINMISKEPSVKYRGIFINDEWPAFGNWSKHNFGGFNAEMYDNVFELILRLKGNFLWPAMWSSSFSCDGPDLLSAELADEYGIVIGTSHHEPCIRHGEEYKKVRGKDSIYGDAWDFRKNREGIIKFWEDGLKRNGKFENIITVGMRGEADTELLNEMSTLENNIELLKDIISVQNNLIRENVGNDLTNIPRCFVIYKEVEEFFYGNKTVKGLINYKELDDVIIMLGDDNFGNVRSMPTEDMKKHAGGYGLYYHFDYHGGPISHEWLNTSYLPKLWEQLTMAYDFGIREAWIVNVGDICLMEYPISYFLELAYDMDKWGSKEPNITDDFTKQWIFKHFGETFSAEDLTTIQEILNIYTHTNHNRKPEAMNSNVYHPVHYGEADNLLKNADYVFQNADILKNKCPNWAFPAFFELVYFPAVASMNVQRMQVLAAKNKLFAEQNRVEANHIANQIADCIELDRKLMTELHTINNGKWHGMGLSEHIGFVNWMDEGNRYPLMTYIEPANKPRIIVSHSHSSVYTEGSPWSGKAINIYDFLRPDVDEVIIDIALGSSEPINYQVFTNCSWLILSHTKGIVKTTNKLSIKIDREQISDKAKAEVLIKATNTKINLIFFAENIDTTLFEPNTFIERDGYVSMEAEHYFYKNDVDNYSIHKLNDYGRTLSAMKVLPTLNHFTSCDNAPYLEYHFVTENNGDYNIELYFAPSNAAYNDKELLIGIQINDMKENIYNVVDTNFRPLDFDCQKWVSSVIDNILIFKNIVPCKLGVNKLKIYFISPCLVLEKIVLWPTDTELLPSYLGPPESYRC